MKSSMPVQAGMAGAVWLLGAVAGLAAAHARVISNSAHSFSVTVPDDCRTDGVADDGFSISVCAPDLDKAASAVIEPAKALLLEVDAETAMADAVPYTEAEFREALPAAVCGETGNTTISVNPVQKTKVGAGTIFATRVTCPEIPFLALGERQADVRFVDVSGHRYLLMARSLTSDAGKVEAAKAGFLASFKSTAEKKP